MNWARLLSRLHCWARGRHRYKFDTYPRLGICVDCAHLRKED